MSWLTTVPIGTLIGKTFTSVRRGDYDGNDAVVFESPGETYYLGHGQDCCESVSIEEIHGELAWLEGQLILMADESSNSQDKPYGSETWTFYRFATVNGYVTVRFHGESNGYYSEQAYLYGARKN